MIVALLEQIAKGSDTKPNLLELKNQLKKLHQEGTLTDTLLASVKDYIPALKKLLTDADPKIRQNAGLCLGMLDYDSAEALIAAYKADETLYNKAAYLKAISYTDYSDHIEVFRTRLETIMGSNISAEEIKHYSEEVRELNSLIRSVASRTASYHTFTGYDLVNEAVLLTNRNFKKLTGDQLEGIPHKEFTAGIMVKTKQLKRVLTVRTFEEILFIPEGIRVCSHDPAKAASELIEAGVSQYILERIDHPSIPVNFHVDLRITDTKFKSDFEKKFAVAFEAASGWHFINSTSDYELEFRFIDDGHGHFNVLIRFCTLEDRRFSYRKKSISVGMKPVTAALCARLAQPYLKANAAVLDPFCGVGTLLVERDCCLPARILYGIDIFQDAVNGAQTNIKAAGISSKTELITKNFFDFHHSHRFDEVITDFPFCTEQRSLRDIDILYRDFFKNLPPLLEKDNVIIIYSRNRNLLRKHALAYGYTIVSEFEISKREMSYLFIIQLRGV